MTQVMIRKLTVLDAINFTQNFVANSRKILDSDLIQNEMLQYIFELNQNLEDDKLINTIDPVILQCKIFSLIL